jgi:RecG-like helicase
MAGQVDADMTEEDYIKSIWERAMFEGDLKYRTMKGEVMDEETELADFKSQQVRKEETMLKRAKKELKEILQEDDVDDDDLVSKINEEDDDDDDDE